jgi:hypothetical protein
LPTNSLVFVAIMLLQYPYPNPGRVRQQQTPNLPGTNTDAVATFTGAFKSADKKTLFLEVEDGNTMKMDITGSTKFFRDDKPAKASDFHQGETVTVDASRDARLNLRAVRVATVPAKARERQPDNAPSHQQPDKANAPAPPEPPAAQ